MDLWYALSPELQTAVKIYFIIGTIFLVFRSTWVIYYAETARKKMTTDAELRKYKYNNWKWIVLIILWPISIIVLAFIWFLFFVLMFLVELVEITEK